ncbi:MAG TPA: C25 family cysteine peptidase [Candidatus Saccharimonadales bacterium]|nr:C25 family cysteine peptidase [Candidatus Saccharimonadales bacterium]
MSGSEPRVRKDSRLFEELCRALLRRGNAVQFRVNGQSMSPNLADGDTVVIVPTRSADLRRGDVALVRNSDGLLVHRVQTVDRRTGEIAVQSDTGHAPDAPAAQLYGRICLRKHQHREEVFSAWRMQYAHPTRTFARRLRTAAELRIRRFLPSLFGVILLAALTFSAPVVHAQTADLQLIQTPSATAVASNASTQSLGTASTVTWAGGVASFDFPTPLPGGVFVGAPLTTTGFTPTSYNLTNATITSVDPATGIVTVALAAQSTGTGTASWASNTGTFTFPTPLPSNAVAGAQITTTGFAPAAYNVTNATITAIDTVGGTISISMPTQSLGTASAASYTGGAGSHFSFTFATPLPSYVAVGNLLTTTGFTPTAYNVINAPITSVNTSTGVIQVAHTGNPGASTVRGTGTVVPSASTTSGTGTIGPITATTNGTGSVPSAYTYSEVVTNVSSSAAVASGAITVYMQTPPNTLFENYSGTNWSCTTPTVGGTGPIVCTYNASLASGATATTLTPAFQVTSGTTAGTTIQNSATVTSTIVDPNPTNNTSLSSIYVEPTTGSDLALSMSVSPTPVFIFSNLTYNIQVQNLGQATIPATSNVLTDNLPAGTTFVSATASAGWSCSGTTTVSCSITSPMAMGATATISITATAPGNAATLTNTASVNLASDPNSANNSATAYTVVQPLVCATPGRDGAGGTLTGVVNAYYPPSKTGTLASGSTSVALGAVSGASTAINAGDLLLIIQMQGATINSTNTSSYGDGLPGDPATGSASLGSSGLFEFVTATSAVATTGGTLTFTGSGQTGGLLNSYSNVTATTTQAQQTYQVIRVPQYTSATLSSGLVPLGWTGKVGGVLAIDVASLLTLGGTVSADALGFRGGAGRQLGGGAGAATDYVTAATVNTNASKGEGIAGSPRYVAPLIITTASTATDTTGGTPSDTLPGGSYARGAPGNAGGGGTDGDPAGNDYNSGGGAGGNGGSGGQGGYGWNSMAATNTTDGGFGGSAFPASTSALVMGGSGGAGTTNNGTYYVSAASNGGGNGIFSSGGAGGGIVIVHAGSVTGSGTVTANGQTSMSTLNDSTGGGGAGGSILVFANSGGLGGLTVSANGGTGGNAWPNQGPVSFPGQRHGPGGGGGGGVIFLTASPANATVNGGANGNTTTVQDSYGATPGLAGVIVNTHIITETPGTQSGAYCASADLAVTNAALPIVVAPGGIITYTQTVTNNGPLAAINAVFSESIPANTTFQSISTNAGWTCTTPSVGGTGTISCTNPNFAAAGSITYAVAVQVNAGTPYGTQIVDVDNIVSGTSDPNLANNSATAITTVAVGSQSDLAVTNTASSLTVIAGNTVTMTAVVTNNGPSAAAYATFTEAIPANTTLGAAFTPPSGWVCNTIAVGATGTLTCTSTSFASGASSTFPVVLLVTPGTTSGTVISATADVNSNTTDPNNANNEAIATTTVAASGQADLAVTSTDSPDPVTPGNNITYAQSITNNGPTAITASGTTTVTFIDAIPASTTLGATFTAPAGWTCNTIAVGATGTLTCTLNAGQMLAVGAVVNFPLVVKVNSATAPGTTITNSPNISSSVGDPNTANNTANTTTLVASPTQASVTIVKTASPEPVNQGTTLTYTITVKNAGPAAAQNVIVTDAIPGEVSYTSSLSSMGSCGYASPTVTCTIGTLGVGRTAVITINVNAGTFSGPPGVACPGYATNVGSCNTGTVSTTTSNVNPNTSSSVRSTIQASTAVDLSAFNAFAQEDGTVRLVWRTHEESRNLGFHIYREDATGRRRVDATMIAGSALLVPGAKPQHAAKSYAWIDQHPVASAVYWIEDVDINGTRTMHGPAYPEVPPAQTRVPDHAHTLVAPSDTAEISPSLRSRNANRSPVLSSELLISRPRPVLPRVPVSTPRFNPAVQSAVKISIDHEGWYHISFAELYAAGLEPGTDVRSLRLFAEGIEQPLLLTGRTSGTPAPSDAIEFYGTGIDTPFSGTRVYWLVRGNGYSKRILTAPASNSAAPAGTSFPFTVVREDRTTYFAALLNGENNDNFFGDVITSDPVDETLNVAHRDTSSAQPLTLELALQGVTDAQLHSVSVNFNGNPVGTVEFFGQILFKQLLSIDLSIVTDGTNTVTLTALNGDNDVSVVQSVQLHYPHTYQADSDWLSATADASSTVHISGFSSSQVRIFDITDPLNISEIAGQTATEEGGYGITATLPTASPTTRSIIAFAGDQLATPVSLERHVPAAISRSGADIVMIAHPDFAADLDPLVNLRESQGHRVAVVTTDQIYDLYNFGERSPFALRAFLQDASRTWARKPQAVLLVGDASLDPRNYLGFGSFDFVPTRIIETAAFKTASDDWLSDFQQTGYATLPTGRLPARTAADVDLLVSKIVGYEQGQEAGPWNSQAVLIADQNVGANFTSAVTSAAVALPSSLKTTQLLADGLDPSSVHSQILNSLNSGALLVNYNGHGAEQQWSFNNFFDNNDAAGLNNAGRLPVYLLIDCLNGLFQDVYEQSLAESLLLAPHGGAVAVWASSGFTDQAPQVSMNLAFLHEMAIRPSEPLGRIILNAKLNTADNDVRRTWNLLGDPSMKLHYSVSAAASPSKTNSSGRSRPSQGNSSCGPLKDCMRKE